MKIITWNVNGVRARGEQLAALVASEQPDVLCLQEIKVAPDHLPKEIDVHPRERNPTIPGQLPEERALFAGLLEAGGLTDLGRQLDPTNEAMYSWWAPWRNLRERNIGWRLDYVLVSAGLAARALACPA